MASEVAPCMPLQLFRRAASSRRLRPHETCRRLAEDIKALAVSREADAGTGTSGTLGASSSAEQQRQDIPRHLREILEVVAEAAEAGEPAAGSCQPNHPAETARELIVQFLAADLPCQLVTCLSDLEFEAKNDVISIFSAVVRLTSQVGAEPIQEYVRSHPAFFRLLVEGHGQPEIHTHCGMMLRSCARHRQIVEVFLGSPDVPLRLFGFMRHESFDISSDAFSSLRDVLLTHKSVSAAFLEANFQEFFRLFNGLLQSDDYVTQRQALKLLSEILLDRTFMSVIFAYIGDERFLQIHMNLLRASSKAIQFEAFHVFKIFVANPQKPPRIQQILYKNKERLVKLLETLRANRADDRQFAEDKNTVIGKLQGIEAPPKLPTKTVAAPGPDEDGL